MKNVKILFKHHLSVWSNLLIEAQTHGNAAEFLLANNARTTVFYLEAITRLLAAVHDKKTFAKLKERFKLLEDSFGVMDYYQGLITDFSSNPKIPTALVDALKEQQNTAVFKTNALLIEQGWLGKNAVRLNKIKQLSKKIDWLDDEKFNSVLYEFYQNDIEKITQQLSAPLNEIEADVHELRRDLRWLSIYPQAFKGFVVLKPARITAAKWNKYLTPKVISSPFNQLTRADDITPIEMNANAFYALSWLIDALGTLKDQGLRLLALTQIWHEIDAANAESLALTALGREQANQTEILSAARIVVAQVKRDLVLKSLLAVRRTARSTT